MESSVSSVEDGVNERAKSKKPKITKKFKDFFRFKRISSHDINDNQMKNACLPEEGIDGGLTSERGERKRDIF